MSVVALERGHLARIAVADRLIIPANQDPECRFCKVNATVLTISLDYEAFASKLAPTGAGTLASGLASAWHERDAE